MKLIEIINKIFVENDFDELLTVYAKKDWNPDSEAILTLQPEEAEITPINGNDYFLEAFIIKDLIEDFRYSKIDIESCNRIIQYAINDA